MGSPHSRVQKQWVYQTAQFFKAFRRSNLALAIMRAQSATGDGVCAGASAATDDSDSNNFGSGSIVIAETGDDSSPLERLEKQKRV